MQDKGQNAFEEILRKLVGTDTIITLVTSVGQITGLVKEVDRGVVTIQTQVMEEPHTARRNLSCVQGIDMNGSYEPKKADTMPDE